MSRNILRKTWISITGVAVIVAGIAMLVLPGPGLVTIAAGLGLLATEFEWAKRLLKPIRRRVDQAKAQLSNRQTKGKS